MYFSAAKSILVLYSCGRTFFSVLCSVGITDDSHFVSSLPAVVSIQHMVQRDINSTSLMKAFDMVLSWLLGIADRWIRASLKSGINSWISEMDTPVRQLKDDKPSLENISWGREWPAVSDSADRPRKMGLENSLAAWRLLVTWWTVWHLWWEEAWLAGGYRRRRIWDDRPLKYFVVKGIKVW